MSKKISKSARRAIAAGVFGTLALGAASGANAGVLAQGVLEVTNFFLRNAGTGAVLSESDFGVLVANHSTDGTATLNGVSDNGTGSVNVYPFTLDMVQQSVGVNPFGQNDYSHRPAGYGGYFARTDTFLTGNSINYDVSDVVPGTGSANGVTAQVVGEVQLNASGEGSTQANIGLQASLIFSVLAPLQVQVDFDADDYLIAFLGPLAKAPGSNAQASSSWSISISGGGIQYTFAPNGQLNPGELSDPCALTASAGTLIPGITDQYSCTGFFSAVSPLLVPGTLYNLNIRHTIETDATKVVPEPGSLALLGAALLGLAGLRRKTKKA